MIIQCSQCSTKFKLDESRIKGASAKVRCARCKHVFTVTKEEASLPLADIVTAFEQTSGFDAPATDNAFAQQQKKTAPESPFESLDTQPGTPETASDTSSFATSEIVFGDVDFGFNTVETPKQKTPDSLFPTHKNESSDQTLEFDSPAADSPFFQQQEEPESYSPFDSLDDQLEAPETDSDASHFATSEIVFGDAGFGFDGSETMKQETPESPFPTHESDSFIFDQPTQNDPSETTLEPFVGMSAAPEEPSATEIDFNADFSSDIMQQQKTPEEAANEAGVSFDALSADAQPSVESPTTSELFSDFPEIGEDDVPSEDFDGEDLPPLSISSRRKSSSSTKLMVLLVIVALAVLGYFGKDFFKGVYESLQKKVAPTQQNEGRILLRSINAEFVNNSKTGNELLVINGEAVNEFSTPRGVLQVKGLLYGPNDQILATQTAYCGNYLSSERLKTMSIGDIEIAMNHQTGSILENLEVGPGKAVSFTIVITPVPETAENFGVEVVGSQEIPDRTN